MEQTGRVRPARSLNAGENVHRPRERLRRGRGLALDLIQDPRGAAVWVGNRTRHYHALRVLVQLRQGLTHQRGRMNPIRDRGQQRAFYELGD